MNAAACPPCSPPPPPPFCRGRASDAVNTDAARCGVLRNTVGSFIYHVNWCPKNQEGTRGKKKACLPFNKLPEIVENGGSELCFAVAWAGLVEAESNWGVRPPQAQAGNMPRTYPTGVRCVQVQKKKKKRKQTKEEKKRSRALNRKRWILWKSAPAAGAAKVN